MRVFRMNARESRVPYLIAVVDLVLIFLFVLIAYFHVPASGEHTHRIKINPSTGKTTHLTGSNLQLDLK